VLLAFEGKPVETYANLFLSATKIEQAIKQQTIIHPLMNPVLINYLKSRMIPYSLGKQYLDEVMTTGKGRHYFSVGFRNDSDGYALRNKHYKGCEGNQDITTFDLPSQESVAVFEGFFDFLSALVFFKRASPRFPTVALNSTSNRKKVVTYLKQFNTVNCFFDRDQAGMDCFRLMRNTDGLPVVDCSTIYDGFNDFNDFLVKTPKTMLN